jgi:hypothetical protein
MEEVKLEKIAEGLRKYQEAGGSSKMVEEVKLEKIAGG